MKSRFYFLASWLLISSLCSVAFAAKTPDFQKNQPDFGQKIKPADDEKKFKQFSFKEDIEKLCKNDDEAENVFLHLSKHHKPKNKKPQQDDENDDDINEVPVPAALWLFGSAFFGLTGLIRKQA